MVLEAQNTAIYKGKAYKVYGKVKTKTKEGNWEEHYLYGEGTILYTREVTDFNNKFIISCN